MKSIGNKVTHSVSTTGAHEFIISGKDDIKRHPQTIKTYIFSESMGMYIHELLLEDGKKEFFLENKGFVNGISQGENEGCVFLLDRMNNAEEIRMDHIDVFYKKNGIWYVYHKEENEDDCIIKELPQQT